MREPQNAPKLSDGLRTWWQESRARTGVPTTIRKLMVDIFDFLVGSLPAMRRRRFGDVDYDFDFRVNTTSATVGWRDRLLGVFHSPYQPTEPALFHEMMASLPRDLSQFVFIDIGSGKGRALLLASDYRFRRILGVELLPELNRIATENIRAYKSANQQCADIESICADARSFVFPNEPGVLYLFNPLPEAGLAGLIKKLAASLTCAPREVWILYHNPILEHVLASNPALEKVSGTEQYVLYRGIAAP